ncbi:MAG: response regulator transcription factor [Bacteroidales bacterium]
MNILIVEDEHQLANELARHLSQEGYLCEIVSTGEEASENLAVNLYDFVLLDLGLPDYDGIDLIHEIRTLEDPPAILIITARGAVEDKVTGLELGADDYLAKPFSLAELTARLHAVARRKFKINTNEILAGEFVIHFNSRTVTCNSIEVELTRKEFDLLLYMVLNRNKTLTRMQLYEHIWGNLLDDQYDSNFIDVHIKNLRKKLNTHAPTEWLKTIRGVGYQASLP